MDQLPITQQLAPDSQDDVAAAIRAAAGANEAVYPIGGGTSLDFGPTPSREGLGLSTQGIARVVDYAARDMTITVESGITMQDLQAALAAEGQQLPVDVPCADRATLGGAMATNFSGPRRFGFGTLRDYVIGIAAVDGRGVTFHGGGRVVKNVAGYDFCKLLIGSLGTLAVITQVTLKVKPRAEQRRTLCLRLNSLDDIEGALDCLIATTTTPTAMELLVGEAWREVSCLLLSVDFPAALIVELEGTELEVSWMHGQLAREWDEHGYRHFGTIEEAAAAELSQTLIDFPDRGIGPAAPAAPLIIQIAVPSSAIASLCKQLLAQDAECQIQAHAGNGILIARFSNFDAGELTSGLVSKLRPAATAVGGHVVVLRSEFAGLTRQIVWGVRQASFSLMESVKQQFDPHGILNPGRFVY